MPFAELNIRDWVHGHWFGRMHSEKSIEMIVAALDHYDLEYAVPGHASKDTDGGNHER